MRILNKFTIITLLQNKRINTELFSSINNFDKPICITCKFYKPDQYSRFDSITSKCSFYGNKNLHTGEIDYQYATECRKNETLCGEEGKLYEEEKLIHIVKLIHHFSKYSILYKLSIFYFCLLYVTSK
jgi:hypothetical protein